MQGQVQKCAVSYENINTKYLGIYIVLDQLEAGRQPDLCSFLHHRMVGLEALGRTLEERVLTYMDRGTLWRATAQGGESGNQTSSRGIKETCFWAYTGTIVLNRNDGCI